MGQRDVSQTKPQQTEGFNFNRGTVGTGTTAIMQPTMVLYRARDDRYEVIDYGMRAPPRSSSRGLPADGRRRGLRHLSLAAREGRPQPSWSRLDRRPGVVLCEGGTNWSLERESGWGDSDIDPDQGGPWPNTYVAKVGNRQIDEQLAATDN
jgi:hypothetical protein